jgi:hypothetical protein
MKKITIISTLFTLALLSTFSVKSQKQVDTLKVTFAGYDLGYSSTIHVSLDSVIKNPFVKCSPNDFNIKSFNLLFNVSGDIVVYKIIGGKLSDENIQLLKKLKLGNQFWVENLEVSLQTKGGITIIPMSGNILFHVQ